MEGQEKLTDGICMSVVFLEEIETTLQRVELYSNVIHG